MGSVLTRKCIAPILALIVRKGCSTVSRRWRIFSGRSSRGITSFVISARVSKVGGLPWLSGGTAAGLLMRQKAQRSSLHGITLEAGAILVNAPALGA